MGLVGLGARVVGFIDFVLDEGGGPTDGFEEEKFVKFVFD